MVGESSLKFEVPSSKPPLIHGHSGVVALAVLMISGGSSGFVKLANAQDETKFYKNEMHKLLG